jgi:glycosyltransferase involved in cell wall biosynthesis
VDKDKIEVVYNGIDFGKLNCNYSTPITNEILVLGSVGRLHEVKGFDLLVEGISKIEDKKTILHIWGEGEERKNLEHLIKSLDLNERVILKGSGYSVGMREIIKDIDIYVQPSRSEGFGLAVAEAMGCGVPVVVTPAGSLPEIVQHNKTGIVAKSFTPEDIALAINELVSNKKLREELSKSAYEYSRKQFGVDEWIDKTISVYLEAAK